MSHIKPRPQTTWQWKSTLLCGWLSQQNFVRPCSFKTLKKRLTFESNLHRDNNSNIVKIPVNSAQLVQNLMTLQWKCLILPTLNCHTLFLLPTFREICSFALPWNKMFIWRCLNPCIKGRAEFRMCLKTGLSFLVFGFIYIAPGHGKTFLWHIEHV